MPFITTKCILSAWLSYEYFGLVVYGPLRSGKSSFSIQLLAECYGAIKNPDWKKALALDYEEWAEWF